MKRVSRSAIRGKPLDDDCRKYGRPDSGQFGENDKRCFCTGIWDLMRDEYKPKCYECNAFNMNAEPPKEEE